MRLLTTGAAGFIGSHLVRSALGPSLPGFDDLSEVVVLDSLTYAGNRANLEPVADDPRLRFVEGSILDVDLIDSLVAGCDAIVHLAAETHVDRSIVHARDFVATNVLGTQTLLDAALRHRTGRFLHVSTDEVYGSIDVGSCAETHRLDPNSPYAASKAASDLLALSYARTHGLDVVVTRGSNTYGPYQLPEKLVPLAVTTLLEDGVVPLYGDGLQVRDWLHVDDHCRGLGIALSRGSSGEIYNLGGGAELTNQRLLSLLVDLAGADASRVVQVEDRPGHDRRYSLDTARIRALGWSPLTPLETGLTEVVRWYGENRTWWEPWKVRQRNAR